MRPITIFVPLTEKEWATLSPHLTEYEIKQIMVKAADDAIEKKCNELSEMIPMVEQLTDL